MAEGRAVGKRIGSGEADSDPGTKPAMFQCDGRRHSCWMLIDVRKKQLRMIYDYTVTEYFF